MTKPDDREDPAATALGVLAAAPPPAPPALSPALEAELAKLAPVAPRRPGRRLALVIGASIAYAGAVLAVLAIRRDVHELPVPWLIAAGAAWLAGFAAPAYLAHVPRKGTMTPRWWWAAAAAVVASVGFVALGLLVHPSGPSSLDYSDRVAHGHGCLWLGLGVALVPTALGAFALRGALPVRSRWIAAALGASGGCLGGLVLHLHCHVADRMHVGLVHGGVVVVAAVLAALIVPAATDRTFD